MIRAEREQQTSDIAIDMMIAETNGVIEGTNAYFDGWETTLEIGQ